MAKYTVEHTCGHDEEHQLFGKHSGFGGRDQKLEWLETQDCSACQKIARDKQHAEANAAAKAANAGLVELQGSVKQVAWAETIRAQFVSDLAPKLTNFKAAGMDVYHGVLEQTSASWWIDRRNDDAMCIMRAAIK